MKIKFSPTYPALVISLFVMVVGVMVIKESIIVGITLLFTSTLGILLSSFEKVKRVKIGGK